MDAAIAETDARYVRPILCSIGTVDGIGTIRQGVLVQKHGRTTGRTQGLIVGTHETIWVDYDGKGARFDRQVSIPLEEANLPAFLDGYPVKGISTGRIVARSKKERKRHA